MTMHHRLKSKWTHAVHRLASQGLNLEKPNQYCSHHIHVNNYLTTSTESPGQGV